MIYLFLGENYFRKHLLNIWKDSFAKKYSEHNIIHIQDIYNKDFSFFEQNLLSTGLFSEKNLFIMDDFPFSSDEENSQNFQKFQEFFLTLIPKINNENIIVFNNTKVDKRSKLYKEIQKIAEIKDFTISDKDTLIGKLHQVYNANVTQKALEKLIDLKGINFSLIQNELDKLFLTYNYIDVEQLSGVSKDIEESIFDIINDILSQNTKQAIMQIRELAFSLDNPYLLYNSFVANLRVYFYIFKLKNLAQKSSDIKNILDLGNRAFLVDKNYSIPNHRFFHLYEKMIGLDSKMKSGKLIGNNPEDMLYEIEKALIC